MKALMITLCLSLTIAYGQQFNPRQGHELDPRQGQQESNRDVIANYKPMKEIKNKCPFIKKDKLVSTMNEKAMIALRTAIKLSKQNKSCIKTQNDLETLDSLISKHLVGESKTRRGAGNPIDEMMDFEGGTFPGGGLDRGDRNSNSSDNSCFKYEREYQKEYEQQISYVLNEIRPSLVKNDYMKFCKDFYVTNSSNLPPVYSEDGYDMYVDENQGDYWTDKKGMLECVDNYYSQIKAKKKIECGSSQKHENINTGIKSIQQASEILNGIARNYGNLNCQDADIKKEVLNSIVKVGTALAASSLGGPYSLGIAVGGSLLNTILAQKSTLNQLNNIEKEMREEKIYQDLACLQMSNVDNMCAVRSGRKSTLSNLKNSLNYLKCSIKDDISLPNEVSFLGLHIEDAIEATKYNKDINDILEEMNEEFIPRLESSEYPTTLNSIKTHYKELINYYKDNKERVPDELIENYNDIKSFKRALRKIKNPQAVKDSLDSRYDTNKERSKAFEIEINKAINSIISFDSIKLYKTYNKFITLDVDTNSKIDRYLQNQNAMNRVSVLEKKVKSFKKLVISSFKNATEMNRALNITSTSLNDFFNSMLKKRSKMYFQTMKNFSNIDEKLGAIENVANDCFLTEPVHMLPKVKAHGDQAQDTNLSSFSNFKNICLKTFSCYMDLPSTKMKRDVYNDRMCLRKLEYGNIMKRLEKEIKNTQTICGKDINKL